MSTEAEKSRRVIPELRPRNSVLRRIRVRMRRIESVTRRANASPRSSPLPVLRLASFVTAVEEGARIFIAAENRNDYATVPLFLSPFRRPPSAR